jgi:Domain of unknown function (DUF5916)
MPGYQQPGLPIAFALVLISSVAADAQTSLSGEQLHVARAPGRIDIDGALGDEGWQGASRIDKWYETRPGDNVEPKVRSVGYLAYDDRYFYAGFEFDDPNPRAIRAPYADRDNISGNYTDYGGVILDTRNDGHSAVLLLATPRGIQYDAVTDDASGEDSSPDFFWDAAARITERGWTLEIRVPFSSLRYRSMDPQTWGIFLYRNYPRDFRYQIFSARIPRSGNCFICRANTLTGLERLPGGGHLVVAPYVSATHTAQPVDGPGSPLDLRDTRSRGGFDLKWTPSADHALDATVKPDFSQIESDTAQISANERFALFYSEKRPFFLEGVELLNTPIQAVYTRTITAPEWGSRLTGKSHGFSYTTLVADDAGGGSVVIPGRDSSALVNQDFGSYVAIGRAKREFKQSFIGMLATVRESHDDNGFNRVIGPDARWQPSASDVVVGQWLVSDTRTPTRPDVIRDWDGRRLTSHAGLVEYSRNTTHLDVDGRYRDFGDGFRADTGFIPQVGYREGLASAGWTIRPQGAVRRYRTSVSATQQEDRDGATINRNVTPSLEMDVRWNGFVRLQYIDDETRARSVLVDRRQFGYTARVSPSRTIAQVQVDGVVGEDIDFENGRPAHGAMVNVNARLNPTNHLELALVQNQRWLNAEGVIDRPERLFLARVSRVRATYMFTAKSFVRVIGQYVSTTRDPSLYVVPVSDRSGDFSGSVLFAYKINWQSVLFVGYGDNRELSERRALEKAEQQFFVKVSYAFQR